MPDKDLARAYSLLAIKSVDDEQRIVTGLASSVSPDRGGDVMEPSGAKFSLPMPFLWQHKHDSPIGQVVAAKVTDTGIEIKAQIAKIAEPGVLRDQVDRAWQSIKSGLVRGLSIGWLPLERPKVDGQIFRFNSWELFEVSAVTIPLNAETTILSVKSFDSDLGLAASGTTSDVIPRPTPSVMGTRVVKVLPSRSERVMKSLQDQIVSYKSTRDQKWTAMNELMTKAGEAGVTFDAEQEEQYDTLESEVKALDKHITRLQQQQEMQASLATEVKGGNPDEASKVRSEIKHEPDRQIPHVQVKARFDEQPGIGLARVAICKMASYLEMGTVSPLDVAKQRYPHDPRVQNYIKATVAAGTSVDTTWAAPLVDQRTLENEFIEYLRAQTIIGKLGLRSLPFNIRIPRQTSGGTGYWVGEGAPKPLTSFAFDAVTLAYTKVAAIAVITQELARFSSPSAEALVRDQLARACIERIDTDLVDPAKAASSGVNPASLTNGLTALSSAGTSADNIRTDIQNLLEAFILANIDPSGVKLIMPNTLALAASLMVTTNGQPSFPALTMNGGSLQGIPVITSQYAANQSSYGNLVIAVDTNAVGLADDGQVSVDVSREASLQMLDNPTNNSATGTATTMVSMFQTNSLAIRAERFINWVKLRTGAVVYMDDVNWGAIGSPV